MNGRRTTSLSDDDLRAMLASRADRLRLETLADVMPEIAGIAQLRRWSAGLPGAPRLIPRLFVVSGGLATLVVVLAVVATPLLQRPSSTPLASGPLGPTTASAAAPAALTPSVPPEPREPSTSPVANGGVGPGGVPTAIDGEPVFTGIAAQARIQAANDDEPFLIGGPWLSGPITCSGVPVLGPQDPNRLAFRGCPRYSLEGVPGQLLYPDMEVADGPIVLSVHSHDPDAETCWNVAACRQVVVVDRIKWQLPDGAIPRPIGVGMAVGRVGGIQFAAQRPLGDKATAYVDEDLFTLPIACGGAWPATTFEVRGDPRVRLLAVFPDATARAAFEAATAAGQASACLDPEFPMSPAARWIALDNLLVAADADDTTAAEIARQLANDGSRPKTLIALPGPKVDLSRQTVADFVAARAAGAWYHADGERLQLMPSDTLDVSGAFQVDGLRRFAANALAGSISLVKADATEADVGSAIWARRPHGSTLWIYRVDYPGATDPALASETFVVVHDSASTFLDWTMVRLDGAPYPEIHWATPAPLPPGVTPFPAQPGADGSGDTPCLPAGVPCGEGESASPLP